MLTLAAVPDHQAEEAADRVAEELIAEEERAKHRAAKKRAKRKRRKARKKSEGSATYDPDTERGDRDGGSSAASGSQNSAGPSDDEEEQDVDECSAFAMKAAGKPPSSAVASDANAFRQSAAAQLLSVAVTKSCSDDDESGASAAPNDDSEKPIEETNTTATKSIRLAVEANKCVSNGEYERAVQLISEAIDLNPSDQRFYGNRSYCYERMNKYHKALEDSNRAIKINSSWPKAHYRQGRAFMGLKKYVEAEKSFQRVLGFQPACMEAVEELIQARIMQLRDMGFSNDESETAIHQHGSVQSACEVLLKSGHAAPQFVAGGDEPWSLDGEPMWGGLAFPSSYSSPMAAGEDSAKASRNSQSTFSLDDSDDRMNPRNPHGMLSLWVGNITADVTESQLRDLFCKYGEVVSIRVMHERSCAFVNYRDKSSPGKAMEALQGVELGSKNLLIRYPDKPIFTENNTLILRKKAAKTGNPGTIKISPINGDECFFWRLAGCKWGDKCQYKHIKEHKNVDLHKK